MKFTKGHKSVKSEGGVEVLVLCTSSDNALYLYQVLPKVSSRVSDSQTQTEGLMLEWSQMLKDCRMDGCTDEQTYERTENQIPISRHA